jgi:DNA-binding CsgD family transcriptional regulator
MPRRRNKDLLTVRGVDLTPREWRVLQFIAEEDLTHKEIAARLHLSVKTVEKMLGTTDAYYSIYRRIGVQSRTEAAAWYFAAQYEERIGEIVEENTQLRGAINEQKEQHDIRYQQLQYRYVRTALLSYFSKHDSHASQGNHVFIRKEGFAEDEYAILENLVAHDMLVDRMLKRVGLRDKVYLHVDTSSIYNGIVPLKTYVYRRYYRIQPKEFEDIELLVLQECSLRKEGLDSPLLDELNLRSKIVVLEEGEVPLIGHKDYAE